jgi:hypothetical protein
MSPVCAGCHEKMDLVGFGLENYDAQGRFRAYDIDRQTGKTITACKIKGDGQMIGVGTFNGPAGLADLALKQNGRMNACVAAELYRFAAGRFAFDAPDQKVADALASRLGDKDFRFDQLLLDLVSSNAFAHRRDVVN